MMLFKRMSLFERRKIKLTKAEAVLLWGIVDSELRSSSNDLEHRGLLRADGQLKRSRHVYTEFDKNLLASHGKLISLEKTLYDASA